MQMGLQGNFRGIAKRSRAISDKTRQYMHLYEDLKGKHLVAEDENSDAIPVIRKLEECQIIYI